jgi:hypothetical protein
LLNDRFCTDLKAEDPALGKIQKDSSPFTKQGEPLGPYRIAAWILLACGGWMIVSPQALLGIDLLKWMHNYAFPGEVLLGALVMSASLKLLAPPRTAEQFGPFIAKISPTPGSASTSARS